MFFGRSSLRASVRAGFISGGHHYIIIFIFDFPSVVVGDAYYGTILMQYLKYAVILAYGAAAFIEGITLRKIISSA